MNWKWWSKYVLNIDTIVAIVIFVMVLYFIFTRKRKRYKFQGLDGHSFSDRLKSDPSGDGQRRPKTRKRKLNKHEEECRRIFQDIFGVRFKSVRPKWLKNPVTKRNLELDGYNPSLATPIGKGLAFEYDGEQHSKFNPHFHTSGVDEFKYQVKKDEWKDMKCKERGVMLVRIPHFVAFQDLDRYIREELKRLRVDIPMRGLFSHASKKSRYATVGGRHAPDSAFHAINSGGNIYG